MTENLVVPREDVLEATDATAEIVEIHTNVTNQPEDCELKTIEVTNISGEPVQTVKAKDVADLLFSNE